jgi:hypothetical protein
MQTETTAEARPLLWTREEPEWVVWVLVIVALVAGWFLKGAFQYQMDVFTDPDTGLTFRYPASWFLESNQAQIGDEGVILTVSDAHSESAFNTAFSVRLKAVEEETTAVDQAEMWIMRRGEELTKYRVLSKELSQVAGQEAVTIDYGYVEDPLRSSALRGSLPVVVRAVDVVFIRDSKVYTLTFASDQLVFDGEKKTLERLLNSVSFK